MKTTSGENPTSKAGVLAWALGILAGLSWLVYNHQYIFQLSKGDTAYSTLTVSGYPATLEDLKQLSQKGLRDARPALQEAVKLLPTEQEADRATDLESRLELLKKHHRALEQLAAASRADHLSFPKDAIENDYVKMDEPTSSWVVDDSIIWLEKRARIRVRTGDFLGAQKDADAIQRLGKMAGGIPLPEYAGTAILSQLSLATIGRLAARVQPQTAESTRFYTRIYAQAQEPVVTANPLHGEFFLSLHRLRNPGWKPGSGKSFKTDGPPDGWVERAAINQLSDRLNETESVLKILRTDSSDSDAMIEGLVSSSRGFDRLSRAMRRAGFRSFLFLHAQAVLTESLGKFENEMGQTLKMGS